MYKTTYSCETQSSTLGLYVRHFLRKVHVPCYAEDVAAELELENLLGKGGRADLATSRFGV